MKRLVLALVLTASSWPISASPWTLVVNEFDGTLSFLDLRSNPPNVHGLYLAGELAAPGKRIPPVVAVSRDGSYALISSPDARKIYKVDISVPTFPTIAGSIDLTVFARILAISPDGTFALAADFGGGTMATIDLASLKQTSTYTIKSSATAGNCLAIAPDNKTVVICDLFSNTIISGSINTGKTGLTSEKSFSTGPGSEPFSAAFSPDGKTLIVANLGSTTVSVFRVVAPGALAAGSTVNGLPGGQESIAFSPDGAKAYTLSVTQPNKLSWLEVTSPGIATLGVSGVASLNSTDSAGNFGGGALAVSPDGTKILAVDPAPDKTKGSFQGVSIVDATMFSVSSVAVTTMFPAGIVTFDTPSPVRPIAAGTLAVVSRHS